MEKTADATHTTADDGDPEQPTTRPEEQPAKTGKKELGGRPGPDPTRFGDWEKNGRCIDF